MGSRGLMKVITETIKKSLKKFKMKKLKKIGGVTILIITIILATLLIYQYDLFKRLLERGPNYTYAQASNCSVQDNWAIANGSYFNSISAARDSLKILKRKYRIPGLAICIAINDEIIWNEGFGCENIEFNHPITNSSLFRIGSISKSMTGIALGKLLDDQKLDLNETIGNVLPSFPKKKYEIRIKDLASHQSGVRGYKGLEMLSNKSYKSVHEAMNIFKDDDLLFEPGTNYEYSSYNYSILSGVIEEITGDLYLRFMDQKIFEPLGMIHTIPDDKRMNYIGYSSSIKKDEIRKTLEVDLSNKWAGGGFLSTPKDLALMFTKLDALLTEESQNKIFESQKLRNGENTGYGLGFRKTYFTKSKKTVIHHGGSSVGGRSFVLKVLEDNIVVAICANSDTGLLSPNNYGLIEVFNIAKLFHNE
jgi:serine beta-lactamase-like protein LACTB